MGHKIGTPLVMKTGGDAIVQMSLYPIWCSFKSTALDTCSNGTKHSDGLFQRSAHQLLAPTGALILMMVRDISVAAAPAFSDFEHLCLSILLQVSL